MIEFLVMMIQNLLQGLVALVFAVFGFSWSATEVEVDEEEVVTAVVRLQSFILPAGELLLHPVSSLEAKSNCSHSKTELHRVETPTFIETAYQPINS